MVLIIAENGRIQWDIYVTMIWSVARTAEGATPWKLDPATGAVTYMPDHALLETLIGIPISEVRGSESGRLAKAIDAWVANELRRCGFPPDEVWPRLTKPRVLPRELGLFLDKLPRRMQQDVYDQVLRNKQAAPSDAKVLGRAYVKQVDVLVAQWSRGPELLVSTKSMVSSFRNNLPNRFEESYGDAKNLRGRHPLASMGFLFVLRSTVPEERGTFERATDMLRKLREEHDVYDATCVILAEWNDDPFAGVILRQDAVPGDLRTDAFIAALVDRVLERTPVDRRCRLRPDAQRRPGRGRRGVTSPHGGTAWRDRTSRRLYHQAAGASGHARENRGRERGPARGGLG
jgi:hypothetical protein